MENGIDTNGPTKEQNRIAKEIEAVFQRFYGKESAYAKGQFYKKEFFLRTDYALVVLNKGHNIFVSFADHIRPSYAALFTMLLDAIEDTNLYLCEDYKTDELGSMILDEVDVQSTGVFIWDKKENYYNMLKKKVKKVMLRKRKRGI